MLPTRPLLVLALAGLVVSCRPPPLTEPPDTGPEDRRDTSAPCPEPPSDAADASSAEFARVASIVGTSCAQANCHGNPTTASAEFAVGTNSPTVMDVRAALEGKSIDEPSARLVEPGAPSESGLYQALQGCRGRLGMPPGGSLSPAKLRTIYDWIARGAPYE